VPAALEATLASADGFEDAAERICRPEVRRLVAVGNGASYYAALALWLASLGSPRATCQVVPIPSGLVARRRFRFLNGDLLLAVSSSGEFRDLVEAAVPARGAPPVGCVAITANADSTLGRRADARALVTLLDHRAQTHTQGFCGNVAAALAVWALVTGDGALRRAVDALPELVEHELRRAAEWAPAVVGKLDRLRAAVVFGAGPAWSAALEAALLLKEVAALPAEGSEAREGGTSSMYALGSDDLAVSVPTGPDPLLRESERNCADAGATVLRLPGAAAGDARVAAVTSFPAALALAVELAVARGRDVDDPAWARIYHTTARQSPG
jgi:glucosamine--fructose-6-phosphate aminotransferase (isomerizing)